MKTITSIIISLLMCSAHAQISIEPIGTDAPSIQENRSKQVIMLTAPWCKWCERMKSEITENKELNSYLMEYRFSYLNVESKQGIVFGNKTFRSNFNGYHELAEALNGGPKIVLPTLVILNDRNEIIYDHRGYMTQDELLLILRSNKEEDSSKK